MAVAGLQNVTLFDSSFHRESQSPRSSQWGEQNMLSTRASSLLQVWRALEGEHVANHPNARFGVRIQRQMSERSNTDSVSTFLLDELESVNGNENSQANDVQNECENYSQYPRTEHDDSNSVVSEQSADLGEVERERVRQVFREWMNSGSKSHASHVSHVNNRSRAQWLGENERERVRVIMDWVQVNCEQRSSCDSPADEGTSEIGPQIEQVRDGLLVNNGEISERKAIRKLCGRQALLDLLARAQREIKRELQELLDHRPVSNFSHRNHIQSLLKGSFLRNERIIQDERLNSRAASELGFLRQRHTVSHLREAFQSGAGNSVPSSLNSSQSGYGSCNEDHDNYRNDQLDEVQEVPEDEYDLFEPSDEERESNDFHAADVEFNANGNTSGQQSVVQAVVRQELANHVEYICSGHARETDVSGNWGVDANALVEENSESEATAQGHVLDAQEIFRAQDDTRSEASSVHQAGSPVEDFEENEDEDLDWQESPAQIEERQESVLSHEDLEWQRLTHVEPDEWEDGNEEGVAGTWPENIANPWEQEGPASDLGEHNHTQEPNEDWHENGLQDAIDSWLDAPSEREVGSLGRVDAFYFPEDDNAYSVELRELLSRRRVSSLLRSGFRASLDQLIQSYVERQGNTSMDWDPDGASSSPSFIEQDQEPQNGDQAPESDQFLSGNRMLPAHGSGESLWDQDLPPLNWSRNGSHHQLGIDWEAINELRMDMVRLQQRLNSMQELLEACMDMQLELQRSFRQEVSAALNRPTVPLDESKDDPTKDDSKWEFVRKGVCCMCCEQNIDSLLYRCGHMCTCSRCAQNLVRQKNKCPMCRAPVAEMVRAYSVQ